MKRYIRLVSELPDSKDLCSRHMPQLDPCSSPLSKLCRSCGRVEALTGQDLYWPYTPAQTPEASGPRRSFWSFAGIFVLGVFMVLLLSGDFASHQDKKPILVEHAAGPQAQPAFTVPAAQPLVGLTSLDLPEASEESLSTGSDSASTASERHLVTDLSRDRDSVVLLQVQAKARKIERQIAQAIVDRAIQGVRVSFAQNTAHLDGLVKTRTQKLAAEQAARTVTGVKKVVSSIQIEWF